MTSFDSLNDLLHVANQIGKEHIALVLGKQQVTKDPDMLYTLVIYYTDYGVFYHESNVEGTPGNAALYKEHQELYKSLGIENSEIIISREPEIRVKELPLDKNLMSRLLNIDLEAVKN